MQQAEEEHLHSSFGSFRSKFISSALALISFSFFTVSLPMWFSLLIGSSREGISCFFRFFVRLVTTTNSSETAGLMLRRTPLLLTALTTIRKGGRLVPASTDSLLSVTLTSLHIPPPATSCLWPLTALTTNWDGACCARDSTDWLPYVFLIPPPRSSAHTSSNSVHMTWLRHSARSNSSGDKALKSCCEQHFQTSSNLAGHSKG